MPFLSDTSARKSYRVDAVFDRDSSGQFRDVNMAVRKSRKARMGLLPPRYSFLLNPRQNEAFTRCPRCKAKTRVRKLVLVIHVESVGLVLLRKTCRRGLSGSVTVDEVAGKMADFKAHMRVDITPRHWSRKDNADG